MSGTRFARSGRCRFFICLGVLVLMLCMVAIFHSSQQQLDETREQRLRCERQQEALNEQLESMAEEKYNLVKSHKFERNEQIEFSRQLEQKLKELTILRTNEQTDLQVRYDKLQQAHKLLQSEHNELVSECQKSKKQLMENANVIEKKLQAARSELGKEKNVLIGEINLWKEKYNAIAHEKERLELLLNASGSKKELQHEITGLEHTIAEYQAHCSYKPKQQQNRPLNAPDTDRNPLDSARAASPQPPRSEKSFSEQVRVSDGLYRIDIKITNKTDAVAVTGNENMPSATNKTQATAQPTLNGGHNNVGDAGGGDGGGFLKPFPALHNRSQILNSVENFQILPKPLEKVAPEERDNGAEAQLQQPMNKSVASVAGKIVPPLSAPRKAASTAATKTEQHVLEANALMKQSNSSSTPSSNGLPPLPLPPNQRKLPENVAPIPANFEELLKNDHASQKGGEPKSEHDANAAEEVDQQKQEDAKNNRYANVVNDMEHKAQKAGANEDSGAHEIKDTDFINDQNFNLPADEDNNFFEGGGKAEPLGGNADDKPKDEDNDDDDGVGAVDAGDIAVKNHNNLLDTNNLNNEVAADQGKEFPDGLRLEEAAEEDEDEDDYSNPVARQQGEAVRN